MKLHPSQRKLLKAIRKNPEATIRELQSATNISSTSVVDYGDICHSNLKRPANGDMGSAVRALGESSGICTEDAARAFRLSSLRMARNSPKPANFHEPVGDYCSCP
jgi:hypothetical protein